MLLDAWRANARPSQRKTLANRSLSPHYTNSPQGNRRAQQLQCREGCPAQVTEINRDRAPTWNTAIARRTNCATRQGWRRISSKNANGSALELPTSSTHRRPRGAEPLGSDMCLRGFKPDDAEADIHAKHLRFVFLQLLACGDAKEGPSCFAS